MVEIDNIHFDDSEFYNLEMKNDDGSLFLRMTGTSKEIMDKVTDQTMEDFPDAAGIMMQEVFPKIYVLAILDDNEKCVALGRFKPFIEVEVNE